MARVMLDIDDPATRITLQTMLEAAGHRVSTEGEVVIADTARKAIRHASNMPSLTLANASEIRDAVAAMREGVYGYVFVPFQPGEVEIMVERAASIGCAGARREQPPDIAKTAESLEEAEMRLILDTLRRCKYNHTEAARLLGIGRNTLWRKLKNMPQSERQVGGFQ